jgi:hypothetical protein
LCLQCRNHRLQGVGGVRQFAGLHFKPSQCGTQAFAGAQQLIELFHSL